MSLPKRRRSLPILLALGLASLVGPVQAFAFDCNGSAGPPDAFTQLNNQLYDSDGHQSRLNLCQTTPKTLSVSVATTLGHAHGATTATVNFGLQTVQAALDAKNIVGQLGGGAAYQLTARFSDVITASAATTFKVTSRLLYTGSRVVSNPTQDHNGASGNLQLSGPSISFNEVVTAGPTGSNLALPIMTGLLHLSAGQLTRIQSYLYADIYVDPNGAFEELPGWARLDAPFITTIDISSGALSASSGHDYAAAAVPEPAGWGLMIGGLALVLGWHRRKPA